MSISQNIRQGYRRRMERGEYITNKPPYGYRNVGCERLEIIPEEMEIYITGDLHGDLRRFQPGIFYEQEAIMKEDIVLVAGDFGCVWHGDERDDECLDWLEDCPGTSERMEPAKNCSA